MSTYVIADVDFWAGLPVPKIIYAGQDFEKAKAKFHKKFDEITGGNIKCVPYDYAQHLRKDATMDEVFEIVIKQVKETGRFDLDTEWCDDYDEPFCIRFEQRDDD